MFCSPCPGPGKRHRSLNEKERKGCAAPPGRASKIWPIRSRQSKSSRSLRDNGLHSDESASPPPDSAPLWSCSRTVLPSQHIQVRLCGCAGRSYPSHSTSQAPVIRQTGTSLTTRTKRVHAASTRHGLRSAMSLSCAQKNQSTLAHSYVTARPNELTRYERTLP
jgi:hypothetical protein